MIPAQTVPPEANQPPSCCPIWRRLSGIAPAWAWALAMMVQVLVVLPFWLYSSPAPFHDVHGDLYRGWPLIYGLDQGDVIGDEWGPFVTYFRPGRFAVDTAVALACGLPSTVLALWLGRRVRRRAGDPGR